MPSSTPKQARFMQAAAHDAQIRKQHGISLATAREFVNADKLTGILSRHKRMKVHRPKMRKPKP